MEDIEDFCDYLLPHPIPVPQRNSLDRKPFKRALKNCDRDAEVLLFAAVQQEGNGR